MLAPAPITTNLVSEYPWDVQAASTAAVLAPMTLPWLTYAPRLDLLSYIFSGVEFFESSEAVPAIDVDSAAMNSFRSAAAHGTYLGDPWDYSETRAWAFDVEAGTVTIETTTSGESHYGLETVTLSDAVTSGWLADQANAWLAMPVAFKVDTGFSSFGGYNTELRAALRSESGGQRGFAFGSDVRGRAFRYPSEYVVSTGNPAVDLSAYNTGGYALAWDEVKMSAGLVVYVGGASTSPTQVPAIFNHHVTSMSLSAPIDKPFRDAFGVWAAADDDATLFGGLAPVLGSVIPQKPPGYPANGRVRFRFVSWSARELKIEVDFSRTTYSWDGVSYEEDNYTPLYVASTDSMTKVWRTQAMDNMEATPWTTDVVEFPDVAEMGVWSVVGQRVFHNSGTREVPVWESVGTVSYSDVFSQSPSKLVGILSVTRAGEYWGYAGFTDATTRFARLDFAADWTLVSPTGSPVYVDTVVPSGSISVSGHVVWDAVSGFPTSTLTAAGTICGVDFDPILTPPEQRVDTATTAWAIAAAAYFLDSPSTVSNTEKAKDWEGSPAPDEIILRRDGGLYGREVLSTVRNRASSDVPDSTNSLTVWDNVPVPSDDGVEVWLRNFAIFKTGDFPAVATLS